MAHPMQTNLLSEDDRVFAMAMLGNLPDGAKADAISAVNGIMTTAQKAAAALAAAKEAAKADLDDLLRLLVVSIRLL